MATAGWFPAVLTLAAAACSAMLAQWLGTRIALSPLRGAPPGHWTDKARLAYPGWQLLTFGEILQPAPWALFVNALSDWFVPSTQRWLLPLVVLASFAGAGVVSRRIESQVRQRAVSFLDWLRGWAVRLLFFLAPPVVCVILGQLLPDRLNWTVAAMLVGAAAVMTLMSYGGLLTLSRGLGLVRPAPERLRRLVSAAAQRVGAPPPAAYLLRWKAANAFALPFSHAMAVTDTLLDSFSDEEIISVCVHEIAHLTEPRRIHLARLTGQFVWLALPLAGPLSGTLGQPGMVAALLLFLTGFFFVRRMVFAMEVRADSLGRSHEGDAGTYARALEKLYEINLMPAMTRQKRPTHPHLYERLLAAGVTPAYPRPEPPSRVRGAIATVLTMLAATVLAFIWMVALGLALGR